MRHSNIRRRAALGTAFKCFCGGLLILTLMIPVFSLSASAATPTISLDKIAYIDTDVIKITSTGCGGKDWVGIYKEGILPGSKTAGKLNQSIWWAYAPNDPTNLEFPRDSKNTSPATLPMGNYTVYLCKNDGYEIMAQKTFTVGVAIPVDADFSPEKLAFTTTAEATANGWIEGVITLTQKQGVFAAGITQYVLRWANENGVMTTLSPLGTVKASSGTEVKFYINEGVMIPEGATAIRVYACKGSAQSDKYKELSLTDAPRPELGELKYTFGVISDLHIKGSDVNDVHYKHLVSALTQFKTLLPDGSPIFTCGDNTNGGTADQWDALLKLVNGTLAGSNHPVYYTTGNHDFFGLAFSAAESLYKNKTGTESLYNRYDIGGYTFITFAGDRTSNVSRDHASFSDKEFTWLTEQLDDAKKSNRPVFLFLHQPLKNTVSGSLCDKDAKIQDWYGVDEDAKMRALLDSYPNVILFTGHTHWQFDSVSPILYGNGTAASYVNCPSVGYLWSDADKSVGGSQGYIVRVYENGVVMSGREFESNKEVGYAQFFFPVKSDESASDGDVTTTAEPVTTAESVIAKKKSCGSFIPCCGILAFVCAFPLMYIKRKKY